MTKEQIIDAIKEMTVLDLNELVKHVKKSLVYLHQLQ